MIPSDIARRNLRRNLPDYAAFFACLAFVVISFYSFAAIYRNPQFARASENSLKILSLFNISAIVVAIFGFAFTWSATGFFLKRRAKEIATYALLGMRKREISLILLAENSVIGLAALATGLGAGLLLSRLAAMALAAMMRLPIELSFAPSWDAAGLTASVFAAIYVSASLRSVFAARRARLVELFAVEREPESPPRSRLLVSLAALVLLCAGYGVALFADWRGVVTLMLPVLAISIAGTYCLFSGLAPVLLGLARRNRAAWLSGTRLVAYTQLGFRLKRNSGMLATIAVLQAVAMSSVSTAASFYRDTYFTLEKNLEFTWEFESSEEGCLERVAAAARSAGEHIVASETIELLETRAKADFAVEAILIQLVRRSDYARRLAARGEAPPPVIEPGSAIAVDLNYDGTATYPWLGAKVEVELGESAKIAVITAALDLDPLTSRSRAKHVLVMDDASWALAAGSLPIGSHRRVRGLSIAHPRGSAALTQTIIEILGPQAATLRAYSELERTFFEIGGILLFIGIFLCLLFFLASCATIGFKQLIDAKDDEIRFALLRKLGLSAREARSSVAIQLRIVFALPLLVGLAHTACAMRMLSTLLTSFSVVAVIAVVLAYLAFSWLFYRATLRSYLLALERAVPVRRS